MFGLCFFCLCVSTLRIVVLAFLLMHSISLWILLCLSCFILWTLQCDLLSLVVLFGLRTTKSVGLKSDGTTGRRDRRRDTWRSICHGPLCPVVVYVRRTHDGTLARVIVQATGDDETRFIARRYVVCYPIFNF